jgi:L-rhamnose isomerase/sugar isomerase
MSVNDRVHRALDDFRIELPSWGFANTGTRFGKFLQPAAASTLEEKFSDAGQVHALTGVCPTVALHVLWDLPDGLRSAAEIARLSARYGVRAGSINPNLFQDQEYKHGSFGNPDPAVRERAARHVLDSVAIAGAVDSRDISLWFADGSTIRTASIRQRRAWFIGRCRRTTGALAGTAAARRVPPFGRRSITDIADWGLALAPRAASAGTRAHFSHHYLSQNIEQSSRGCSPKGCSAASTSTIAATPTTT